MNKKYFSDGKTISGKENIKKYNKEFTETRNKYIEIVSMEELFKDKNFQKGKKLAEKYSMANWDEVAKNNAKYEKEIREKYFS